jgi:hypothetical protein
MRICISTHKSCYKILSSKTVGGLSKFVIAKTYTCKTRLNLAKKIEGFNIVMNSSMRQAQPNEDIWELRSVHCRLRQHLNTLKERTFINNIQQQIKNT